MSIVSGGIVIQAGLDRLFSNLIQLGFLLTTAAGLAAVYAQALRLSIRTFLHPERTNYFRGLYIAVGLLIVTAVGQVIFTSYILGV